MEKKQVYLKNKNNSKRINKYLKGCSANREKKWRRIAKKNRWIRMCRKKKDK